MTTRYAQAIAIAMLTIVSTAPARAQDKVATGDAVDPRQQQLEAGRGPACRIRCSNA